MQRQTFFFGVFLTKYFSVAVLGLLALFYVPSETQFVKQDGHGSLDENKAEAEEDVTSETCPEKQSSCFSRYTFSWMNSLMSLGHKRPLEKRMYGCCQKRKVQKFLVRSSWYIGKGKRLNKSHRCSEP